MLLALVWLARNPDWEPAITLIGLLATFFAADLALTFRRRSDEKVVGDTNKPEIANKQAAIYDEQVETLKMALSLVYRARNAARHVKDKPDDIDRKESREKLHSLRSYHCAMEELLFEQRAILPQHIFVQLHDLKNEVAGFVNCVESYRHKRRRQQGNEELRVTKDILSFYERLDSSYQRLVRSVQTHMGTIGNTA